MHPISQTVESILSTLKQRRNTLLKSAFLPLATLSCFLPFIVLLFSGIWSPTAMVQETFTTNFMWLKLMTDPFELPISLPVGHAQILLFSYPVTFITDLLFGNRSIFDQFELFGVLWHAWSGLILASAIGISLFLPMRWHERFLLLLLPLSAPLLARSTNLGVFITYDRAQILVAILLAMLLILWTCHRRAPALVDGFALGAILAYATATKFTFGIALAPLSLVMFAAAPPRKWLPLVLAGSIGFGACFGLLVAGFFLLKYSAMTSAFNQLVQYFSGAAVSQHDTTIVEAFRQFLQPRSWYFGLQIALLVSMGALIALLVRGPTAVHRSFVLGAALALSFYCYVLSRRLAFSSMIDLTILVILISVVSIAILVSIGQRLASTVLASTLLATMLAAPLLYDFHRAFSIMRDNSQKGRELQGWITAPNLPMIYYHDDWHQRLIFPDPGIMLSTLLPEPGWVRRPVMSTVVPGRTFIRHPRDGVISGAHMAIIPEFIPKSAGEPPPIQVFGKFPDFDDLAELSRCKVVEFTAPQQWGTAHYYYYSTRVTACIRSN